MELQTNLQKGGKSNDETKYLKLFKKIKTNVKDKGNVLWFDSDGTLLKKGTSFSETKQSIIKKIKKDKKVWNGEVICSINIRFVSDDIMNAESGAIDIAIDVDQIYVKGDFLAIHQKDETNSLMRLFYRYDELDKFKLTDMKRLALMMIKNDMKKVNAFKFYHYEDVEKFLKKY